MDTFKIEKIIFEFALLQCLYFAILVEIKLEILEEKAFGKNIPFECEQCMKSKSR